MPVSNELELIARAKEGDIAAFAVLYETYKGSIYRTALAITHDQVAAEEILQETFLRAFRHLHHVREGAPLAPWLHRISVNLSYSWTSRQKQWLASLEQLVDRVVVPARNSPEQTLEHHELQEMVWAAINQLDFPQRATIVLFYLEGFNQVEISEIMECPVGTVKSRLHYGREKLRQMLLADRRLPREIAYEFT